MPVSWLRVGCAAWTCQPPTPTPPSAAARSALERPPTYPHLRKNSAACGGVYLPTPLGSEGKSVSLGIPLEKECSPASQPRQCHAARGQKWTPQNFAQQQTRRLPRSTRASVCFCPARDPFHRWFTRGAKKPLATERVTSSVYLVAACRRCASSACLRPDHCKEEGRGDAIVWP